MSKTRTISPSKKLTAKKVVELARKYLEPHQPADYQLIVDDAELQPDGCWYVFVRPSREDIRMYEYDGRIAEATVDMLYGEDFNVMMLDFKPPEDD